MPRIVVAGDDDVAIDILIAVENDPMKVDEIGKPLAGSSQRSVSFVTAVPCFYVTK